MKIRKKIVQSLCMGICILFMLIGCNLCIKAQENEKKVNVLFLHDLHSHLDTFQTVKDGNTKKLGGFARIKTAVMQQEQENKNTFFLDGGDFSMGTLFQTIFETDAAELQMLGQIGVDVTTFGNHEFDYGSEALSNMLRQAKKNAKKLPQITICNVDWDQMEQKGLSSNQQLLKDAFSNYQIKDYVIINKNGIKMAVIGVFGKNAKITAPTCELEFTDPVEAVKKTVKEIQKKEQVDLIACISHSGTDEKDEESEDENLAKAVPEIDVIVSGHTHTTLEKPIVYGDTYIVSCGEYGENIGNLSLKQNENGRWDLEQYELIPITEQVKEDQTTKDQINQFMQIVEEKYLKPFGYTKNQILAHNTVDFCTVNDLYDQHEDGNLGNFIADAYKYAVEREDTADTHKVDVAIAPSGTIRDTYGKGNICIEDVFQSFSLGIGKDGVTGYPLLSVYLTGKELKTIAEVDASVSESMSEAKLYMNGLHMEYNPHRFFLNKVTDCYLTDQKQAIAIQDDQLYRVVTDLYTGQMLDAVTEMSYHLLAIVPKDADGKPIKNLKDAIVYNGQKELKAFIAIADYMASFEDIDKDGISDIPSSYGENEGRKIRIESKKIWDLLKNPSIYCVAAYMILCLLVITIFLLCDISF